MGEGPTPAVLPSGSMPDLHARIRAAVAAPFLALLAAVALAPAAYADVVAGGDTEGGTILFWLTVIACVGVAAGTVIFYVYRRRHR
jgi:hypothetical protein